jgi:hypothetical protein
MIFGVKLENEGKEILCRKYLDEVSIERAESNNEWDDLFYENEDIFPYEILSCGYTV